MVKIIDGEIVQDDDPRLAASAAQRRAAAAGAAAPPAPAAAAAGGAAPARGNAFDFSQPLLRLEPATDGVAGLPNLRIFGALMRSQHAMLIAAAALFMGPRGLLLGLLVWWIYSGSAAGQAAQQPGQAQRAAAAQDRLSRLLGQAPLGRAGDAPHGGHGGGGGPGPAAAAAAQPQDPWAARGRARKLNES